VLAADPALADYYESVARVHGDPKAAANWVTRDVLTALNETGESAQQFAVRVRPEDLAGLLGMVRDGSLSRAAGTAVFNIMRRTGESAATIAERDQLTQVSDDAPLRKWIDEVFDERPDEARRYLAGERKLQGVLVGLVMKKSKGTADPKRLNALLAARLPS